MGDYNNMGPSIQLFGATLLNFSPIWQSRNFQVHEMLISPESTAFSLHAGRRYKLVTVTVGRSQQAMHAGGDDHQLPCGAFFITK